MRPKCRKTNIIVLLITFCGLYSSNLFAQDVSSIYRNSRGSIVLIVSYDNSGTPVAMGTGFYFKKNLLATNHHVVDGASSFLVKNIGTGQQFKASQIRSYSEMLDIALIEVAETAQPLEISQNNKQNIGEKVVVIGNPRGLEGSVSTGIISGIRPISDFDVYQLTAPISPGSSGGPVFNIDGEVLGIATFTIRESQNLNFAMPASLLDALGEKKMKWEPVKNIESVYKKENAGIKLVLFVKNGPEFNESISLKNTTQNTIKDLTFLLFYKTMDGEIFNYRVITFDDVLPPGFAKMKTIRSFDQEQNFKYCESDGYDYAKFDIQMKVLSYDIIEAKNNDILDAISK